MLRDLDLTDRQKDKAKDFHDRLLALCGGAVPERAAVTKAGE